MWKIKSVVIAIAPVLISLLIGLYYNNNNRKCINPPGVVKYWPFLKKMWNKNDNLRTMKRVFDRLGNEMVNGSVDPDWDVMWSIEYPFIMFSNQMKNLKPHQKVNHFPGIGVIAHKAYMTTHNKLPFIPAAFEFPRMYDEFKSFAEINPDRKFVIKNGDNRGVKVMSIDKMNFKESSGTFIQEFIANPLLIDGHLFDMGVYVLISSINPLRIYRFKSEVLLNFCTDPYYPFDPENVKKYVIRNERKPVFEMYSLRDMILKMGFSLKKSFETHYESLGGDVEGLWNQIDDAIVSLLLRNEEHIIKTTSNFGSTDHFFELVRIDFMIDDNFVAHLIEVNMSPNLTPAEDKYLRLGPGYEQLVFHTLQCVLGLSSNHHLSSDDDGEAEMITSLSNLVTDYKACIDNNCEHSCENVACRFCAPCFDNRTFDVLRQAYLEHIRKGDMMRIFPTTGYLEDNSIASLSSANRFMMEWFQRRCEVDKNWC